jgi:beta-fructofuranosidase
MAVGGGFPDGRAVALQYSSADLRHWDLDGVLADRPAAEDDPLGTGSVWECVQFFPLDGRWVLLVSVWETGEPRRMAAAVGAYDGHRFTARSWQRFTATDALYAATTFLDADGRRCALSWLREAGAAGDGWAGMLSVPVVLTLDGDRLVPGAHPAVDSLRGPRLASLGETAVTAEPLLLGPVHPSLDVLASVDPAPGGPVRVAVREQESDVLVLVVDPGDGAVVVSRPGREDERVPLGRTATGAAPVRLLLDAGIAEIVTTVDVGAVQVASGSRPVSLEVSAPGGRPCATSSPSRWRAAEWAGRPRRRGPARIVVGTPPSRGAPNWPSSSPIRWTTAARRTRSPSGPVGRVPGSSSPSPSACWWPTW